MKVKDKLLKARTLIRACFFNYPYWRVHYTNGERTFPMSFSSAHSLSQVFKGKVVLDYSIDKAQ